jgi:predicted Zn finger-like uncharacterized protein
LIIQCPSCHARYNYDDTRFAAAAAKKIRCTRCTSIFEIVNPAAGAPARPAAPKPAPPPAPERFGGLPGPDDFALDETALTEASKRRRAIPGAPARAATSSVPLPPLPGSPAQDATAPPPGFGRASTTDKAPASPAAAGIERRLRLPAGFRYSLACIAGPEAGKIFEVARPRVVIGRGQTDIVLGDIQCSRQHAAIEVLDDKVYLVDLNSTNGTWIGDQRVTRVEIDNRAEFEIGTTTLMLIRSATDAPTA